MPKPKNPEIVVVKNKFYPKGLNEQKVWDYYQYNRSLILRETQGLDLMFGIAIDENKFIYRRKINSRIQLNNNNYEIRITGRTVVIYSLMKAYSDFGIVDIDVSNWVYAKQITQKVYGILSRANFITGLKILYTGKTSFHIHCKFSNKLPIDKIREILKSYLDSENYDYEYTVYQKRQNKKPNLDLWACNKYNGAYITKHSLSILGLKCLEVPINGLTNFQQWKAQI